jgi:O-glycosyl hydrolase
VEKTILALVTVGLIVGAARPAGAQQTTVVVSPLEPAQRIDGFGASSAWTAPDMMPGDPSTIQAFSTDGGVGLSLLRIRIAPCTVAPNGACSEYTLETTTAQTAQAMGVKVWATPWTPPAAWKSNDSTQDGGTLLTPDYGNWANALVGFVQSMQSQGVNLVGLSAQNEPTEDVDYDSCLYTPDTLANFVGNYLGPALQDAGLLGDGGMPFGIIAPETVQGDSNFTAFSQQILSTNASNYVGTIATHSYGAGPPSDPAIAQAGKEYWETEVYDEGDVAALDAGAEAVAAAELSSALYVGITVNQALSNGVNAWHYWWLYGGAGGNEGLFNVGFNTNNLRVDNGGGSSASNGSDASADGSDASANNGSDATVDGDSDATVDSDTDATLDTGSDSAAVTGSDSAAASGSDSAANDNSGLAIIPTKRLWALGNYSRFVRPGFSLVYATQYPALNVYVSAFYDAPSNQIVVVAVNANPGGDAGPGTVPVTFLVDRESTGSWTSWVTSASQDLTPGDPVTVNAASGNSPSSVNYTLQPESITTLQGLVTGPGPAVSADAGSSIAIVAPEGGVFLTDTATPTAPSGCALACSAVGAAPKREDPWRLAFGVSLGVCALARWRTRRRRALGRAQA